jgi:hypothetical protein
MSRHFSLRRTSLPSPSLWLWTRSTPMIVYDGWNGIIYLQLKLQEGSCTQGKWEGQAKDEDQSKASIILKWERRQEWLKRGGKRWWKLALLMKRTTVRWWDINSPQGC